ncbi:MAG: hypothetical protein SWH61_06525 [Thermodesulfobacteriota bacterium]|nr:hypothetical protein [Thermodesulfobacteriota bacterium]
MKKIIFLLCFVCLAAVVANADDFSGTWKVVTAIYNDTYMGEIKYPQRFTIENNNGDMSGHYTDQHGFESDFEKVAVINDGRELLLSLCCGTKHAESWAPLHKAKLMDDGMLHGVVVTDRYEFKWVAEPVVLPENPEQ